MAGLPSCWLLGDALFLQPELPHLLRCVAAAEQLDAHDLGTASSGPLVRRAPDVAPRLVSRHVVSENFDDESAHRPLSFEVGNRDANIFVLVFRNANGWRR